MCAPDSKGCACAVILPEGVAVCFGRNASRHFIKEHYKGQLAFAGNGLLAVSTLQSAVQRSLVAPSLHVLRHGKFVHRGIYNESKICSHHAICISCHLRLSTVYAVILMHLYHMVYCKHSHVFGIIINVGCLQLINSPLQFLSRSSLPNFILAVCVSCMAKHFFFFIFLRIFHWPTLSV